MKAYDVFKEYIWLVNTIRKARKISLEEINRLWRETDMSGGVEFHRTTFTRHRNAIDIELYLKPTMDFSGKLLSRGSWIEVLEPQWLREDVVKRYKEAISRYE